jgi:acid phosphatase family membrane protein YuiD
MSLIVIYDRGRMYSIYNTFQKRYPDFAATIKGDPVLKDLVGHRPSEIIAGVIIGAVSGLVTLL